MLFSLVRRVSYICQSYSLHHYFSNKLKLINKQNMCGSAFVFENLLFNKIIIGIHKRMCIKTQQFGIDRNADKNIHDISDLKRESSAKMKRPKKEIPPSKEVLDYFNLTENLKSIPNKLMKVRRITPEHLYVMQPNVAEDIVSIIKDDLLDGDGPVLEANPGLGLITEALLRQGIPRVRLYEASPPFVRHLNQTLKEKYNDRITLMHCDLFSMWKMVFQDKLDNGARMDTVLEGIAKRSWTDGIEAAMKIVGVLPSLGFIKHLLNSITFQTGIMIYGRPELYLIMNPALYIVTGYLQYRASSVLFQILFTSDLLTKLPRKAILPWIIDSSTKKLSNVKKIHTHDSDFMYLVKIAPRRDIFESLGSANNLQPLWYFVRHHMTSRRKRIIPELERWIPNCGPRLIMRGINIFTEFGDLTPHEILLIFQDFLSWPEYPMCTFPASMETALLKMEPASDDFDKDMEDTSFDTHVNVDDLDEEDSSTYIRDDDDDHNDKSKTE
uniref:rRNA adenine N(6)-methyltransferase n=1 Tax=Timema tahoe TaxID=61484 RepID=A0A7R9IFQ5_9NEOP|nr:unnamed protein product [Timema tahoe]